MKVGNEIENSQLIRRKYIDIPIHINPAGDLGFKYKTSSWNWPYKQKLKQSSENQHK